MTSRTMPLDILANSWAVVKPSVKAALCPLFCPDSDLECVLNAEKFQSSYIPNTYTNILFLF